LNRVKDFPQNNVIHKDFFEISDTFDLIIEQTFFCSLLPSQRLKYVKHIKNLLSPSGRVAGLLFTFPLNPVQKNPPFGGSISEYRELFAPFKFKTFETAYNSHPARQGNEIFFILEKE
ncbi:MAG: SAM-dependent methyltransferase, partial [Calditrichaeota bacterium]|nr:SAM-dependent methyltransferase [Calditrichota bacterium]